MGATLKRDYALKKGKGKGSSSSSEQNVVNSSRSLRDNIEEAKGDYEFNDGHFGHKNTATSKENYVIEKDDPIEAANDLYAKLSKGGREVPMSNGHGIMTTLKDGTVIKIRIETRSSRKTGEDSPAVEIDIRQSNDNCGVKSHKIHFIKRKK